MRISTSLMFSRGLFGIQDTQSKLSDTQQRISSGNKILSPADDPAGSVQLLRIDEQLTLTAQYQSNIKFSQSRNALEDSVLDQMNGAIQRVSELAIQANSAALNASDRNSIADEVRGLLDELQGLMNTTDGSGEHIFSGFKGDTQPFSLRNGGGYDYHGDAGQRSIQVGSTTHVEISDSGKYLFVDTPSAHNTVLTHVGENNSPQSSVSISTGQVIDQAALDNVFPEDFVIEFQPIGDSTPPGFMNFNVTRRSDGAPVMGSNPPGYLNNVIYRAGDPIAFHGVEIQMHGVPVPGDQLFVDSSPNEGLLSTVDRLIGTLQTSGLDQVLNPLSQGVIGFASPPAMTAAQAGNYIAAQTITVTGSDGSVQTLAINAGDATSTIAAGLNGMTGISASANPTQATLDFSQSVLDSLDTVQFDLNGASISAAVGATNAITYANIEAAINAAYPVGPVSVVNNNDGTFDLTEANGDNLAVENFTVVDGPGPNTQPGTVQFSGPQGATVTLLEGSADSSQVAASLNITVGAAYEIASSVSYANGGTIAPALDPNAVVENRFETGIQRALDNLVQAETRILQVRASIGARLNKIESTEDTNARFTIELKSFRSTINDVDYAEAITQLNMETLVLEASQSSFAKISRLSLFDFIR